MTIPPLSVVLAPQWLRRRFAQILFLWCQASLQALKISNMIILETAFFMKDFLVEIVFSECL